MPLRRRPPEPSPRLRALLARADSGGGIGAVSVPPGVGAPEPRDVADGAGSAWTPQRSWLEASAWESGPAGGGPRAREAAVGAPAGDGRQTGDGRQAGRGRQAGDGTQAGDSTQARDGGRE